jgi:UDP-3-O-[3-hydroxymyristoyl] glucosamine N-acyltransferase
LELKGEVKATLIKVDDAYGCFAKLLELYAAYKPKKSGVHPTAVVAESAKVGEGCYIGAYVVVDEGAVIGDGVSLYPHVYVGDGATIGDGTTLHSGVKVYEGCKIGKRCIVHSGAVIGSDGFGFAPNAQGSYDKIPQIGIVTIEDDVEIGANTTIDRATMGSTVIAKGAKLDNLVQIGHNVVVGESTVMAGQSAVAGSAKVGKHCMIGGQSGIVGHVTVGDGTVVASVTGVSKSVPAGSQIMGSQGIDVRRFRRVNAVYRNLPELQYAVNRLEKKGFVTRRRSTSDARQVLIELTEEGIRAAKIHRRFHRSLANTIKKDITEEEQQILIKCIERMNEFIINRIEDKEGNK